MVVFRPNFPGGNALHGDLGSFCQKRAIANSATTRGLDLSRVHFTYTIVDTRSSRVTVS